MTQFSFIRHVETEMNTTPHLIGGRSNHTPPTARGVQEGILLGTYFGERGIQPDAVFVSGAVRTNETARLVLTTAGITVKPVVDERLLELSQGQWEGIERTKAYTPEVIAQLDIDGIHGGLPGAETIAEAQDRMYDHLMEKSQAFPVGYVLSFSHGLAIRALVGKINGLSKSQILEHKTPNASITRIDVVDGQPHVLSVGESVISE